MTRHTRLIAASRDGLEALVQAAIQDGWRPRGGMAALQPPGQDPLYAQTMVRCVDASEDDAHA